MSGSQRPDSLELKALLLEARTRTLALALDLREEQLRGPRLATVNPPLWEVGHVGWFQEHWCLRYREGREPAPPRLAGADGLYDSATVAHGTRWDLPLPDLAATLNYLERVLEAVLERLEREGAAPGPAYFIQLAAFHEQMHCEALTYARQTLGYAGPVLHCRPASAAGAGPCPGDVAVPGGPFMLGAHPGSGFVFDNEKWAHEVRLKPFVIARAPVTNSEYAAFVDDGGYLRPHWWHDEGWRWRERAGATAPIYWVRDRDGWMCRWFDKMTPLAPHAPVIHVNWYEADAYCRWAGRRLPTEAEWEQAASTTPENPGGEPGRKLHYPWGNDLSREGSANLFGTLPGCTDVSAFAAGDSAWGCRQMLGNAWEWTADPFLPYPGFARDPYKEYSEPWFGSHRVLKGGCHATHPRLIRNTWRNFYTPERRDIYASFRTCASG